jgi:hypothetical protein
MDELELQRVEIEAEITGIRGTAGYRDNAALRRPLEAALLEKEIIDLNIKINDIKRDLQTTNADERARKEAKIERKEAEIAEKKAKIERKEADIIRKKLLILNLPPAPAGPSCEEIISLSFTSVNFSFCSSTSPRSPTRSSSSKRSGRLIHHHLLSIHLSCVCRFL